ncbi:MAG: 50S ribosomal protein L29 [Candidatus Nanoarchaeia archaeon]
MAIVRPVELRKLSKEELNAKKLELEKELMKLNAQKSTGTLASPGKVKAIKKAIAKIETIKRELAKSK